jgi:hypothetical protein
MTPALRDNARDLERELAWLGRIIEARLASYFGVNAAPGGGAPGAPNAPGVPDAARATSAAGPTHGSGLEPPDVSESPSSFARVVREHRLSSAERVGLALALAPHLRPQLLDVFFTRNQTFDRHFTEFGGLRSGPDGEFWPTGETLAFVLGATDIETRLALELAFEQAQRSGQPHLIELGLERRPDEPMLRARLLVAQEYLHLLTTGERRRGQADALFPAQHIETGLEWPDRVLHPSTRTQIEEIQIWIEHGPTLMGDWGMASKLRPGCRVLFYGPPGTGKTMTACLLGKSTGRDVYRVDLSLVTSKYIGETERNLARVLDQAQHRGWILFFDEADALFGKRSETRDAHDRYANQQVSFLLQRIETFDGIAILASNFLENLDPAFARRFETMIYFPLPRPEERARLWQQGFSPKARLCGDVDLNEVAREYPLSGGSILDVVRYASLQALHEGGRPITLQDIQQGVRREHAKEGKSR